jgi:hypothetical protein
MEAALLLFWIRSARRKARGPAAVEALRVLRDLPAMAPPGGPLSDRKGVFWVSVPAAAVKQAEARLPRLGYTSAVDLLSAEGEALANRPRGRRPEVVRWRGREWEVVRVYEEDEEATRAGAPDRRPFLIEKQPGVIEPVQGYRGDGGLLSRRGLPVADARLLVNLVGPPRPGQRFLDPFAGVGGLLIEARASGWYVASADVDPFLRHGLAALSDEHHVADARSLPFPDASFAAAASEPPYHPSAAEAVAAALGEMNRVLEPGGALVLLCALHQAPALRERARASGLVSFLDAAIDRKGTGVVVLAWDKPGPAPPS